MRIFILLAVAVLGLSSLACVAEAPAPRPAVASLPAAEPSRRDGDPQPSEEAAPAPISVAAMRFIPDGAPDRSIEIAADGRVVASGRIVARFAGDSLLSVGGAPIASVAADGTVRGFQPGFHFERERLTNDGGTVIEVFPNGAVEARIDGQPRSVGKFEGDIGAARRAAALAVVLFLSSPELQGARPTPPPSSDADRGR